jgi:UDP-N-acetyl-2-amino-2-deoxyglucuronate dehydrogenase
MAKKDTLRFGVIGVNGAGFGHVKTAIASPAADLVALCDIDRSIAEARRDEAQVDVPIYTDYREMIEREDLDAVALGTPHYLHAPMAVFAASKGLHVLTEKPLAISVDECDEMIAACDKAGVVLGVGHQRRWHAAHRGMRDVIRGEKLGRPMRFFWSTEGVRHEGYYASGAWRGTWEQEGGGALINQYVHDLDALCYLLGKPVEVQAYAANWGHENEVDDLSLSIVRFDSGWVGTISLSLCSAGGNGGMPNTFEGDAGVMQGTKIAMRSMSASRFIAESPNEKPTLGEWTEVPAPEMELQGRDLYYEDFLKAANGELEYEGSGRECIHAVELVNAILLSQTTGRRVTCPLDRGEVKQMFADLRAKRSELPRMR